MPFVVSFDYGMQFTNAAPVHKSHTCSAFITATAHAQILPPEYCTQNGMFRNGSKQQQQRQHPAFTFRTKSPNCCIYSSQISLLVWDASCARWLAAAAARRVPSMVHIKLSQHVAAESMRTIPKPRNTLPLNAIPLKYPLKTHHTSHRHTRTHSGCTNTHRS